MAAICLGSVPRLSLRFCAGGALSGSLARGQVTLIVGSHGILSMSSRHVPSVHVRLHMAFSEPCFPLLFLQDIQDTIHVELGSTFLPYDVPYRTF